MKIAKPVYKYDWFCGNKSFANGKLKSLAQDSMHNPYVRAKQNGNNLPEGWDTKWIKRQKSWKHRSKKKKQWVFHKKSDNEIKFVMKKRGNKNG